MRTSENINELALALSKAQGQMESAKKDSTNPHFRSKYADLAAVVEAIKKPLTDNGLSYLQGFGWDEHGALIVHTRLLHSSGQWVESDLRVRPVKDDPQGVGSAVSYGRRYALQSLVGLTADDDDGNASSTAPRKAEATNGYAAKDRKDPAAPVDSAKAAALTSLSKTLGEVNKANPRLMPFLATDHSEKAAAHRRGLVGQVLGQAVSDIRELSTVDIQQASDQLRQMYVS
ncbi:MAG: ERF superfamily protein [Actinobacteria bacterium]|nr:ERF superfamily protein [Actinomycetota bacterium]